MSGDENSGPPEREIDYGMQGAQAADSDEERVSFEDSERFEDDSICSFPSENDSLNYKWRNGARPLGIRRSLNPTVFDAAGASVDIESVEAPEGCGKRLDTAPAVKSLVELSARRAARDVSSELIESTYTTLREGEHMPEHLLIPILKHCFPESVEDIRLYSCLANGNANQFNEGEHLYQANAVGPLLQIGYHLSGTVNVYDDIVAMSEHNDRDYLLADSLGTKATTHSVSIRIDRCRAVHCSCTCADATSWCAHTVAVCLKRINDREQVTYRPQIWDSIAGLEDDRLKKFAQYLINELPREYLPIAQRLIDSLYDSTSEINASGGVPDPTAGGLESDVVMWCMDEATLHSNLRSILVNFTKPSPTVHCDVQYLSNCNSPAVANEWCALSRPHRSREPEPLWNLLSIVKEMFKRGDENATSLLHMITRHCIGVDQLLMWWYQTQLVHSGRWQANGLKNSASLHSQVITTQYHTNSLFEEIVNLWRLAALNPLLSPDEHEQLASLLRLYHTSVVERIWAVIEGGSLSQCLSPQGVVDLNGTPLNASNATFAMSHFPCFFPALRACNIDWANEQSELQRTLTRLDLRKVRLALLAQKGKVASHGQFRNLPFLREGMERIRSELTTDMTVLYAAVPDLHSSKNAKSRKKHRRGKGGNNKHGKQRNSPTPPHNHPSGSGGGGGFKLCKAAQISRGLMRSSGGGSERESNADSATEELPDALFSSREHECGSSNAESEPYYSGRRRSWNAELDAAFAIAHAEIPSFELRFLLCEALKAHGYTRDAYRLAKELANEFNPAQGMGDVVDLDGSSIGDNHPGTSKSFSISAFHMGEETWASRSGYTATALSRAIFLIRLVLAGDRSAKSAANVVGLALRLLSEPKYSSATRYLDIRIHHLEGDLLRLLQQGVELGDEGVPLVEEMARNYLTNIQKGLLVSAPALTMAHYMVEAFPACPRMEHHQLVLEVALHSLGCKVNISAEKHPMLCESIRRQRGELAMTLLLRYRDSAKHLAVILDRMLDKRICSMYRDGSSNGSFFMARSVPLQPKGSTPRVDLPDAGSSSTQESQGVPEPNVACTSKGEANTMSTNTESGVRSSLVGEVSTNQRDSNEASEAQIHFMVEFAKRLRDSLGGNQNNTAVFYPMPMHQFPGPNNTVPHRNLHICAFLIGLYALRMNNIVFPNWETRTYSTHVSWLQTQAQEIGRSALGIIRKTWEIHFTPTEVASLADKASQVNDPTMVQEAARLALSVLSHAASLTPVECQNALNQCKGQGPQMLEEACNAIERAVRGSHTLLPEVLFKVARHWHDLHAETKNHDRQHCLNANLSLHYRGSFQQPNVVPAVPPPLNYYNVVPPPPIPIPPPPPPPTATAMNQSVACTAPSWRPLPTYNQLPPLAHHLSRLHVSYSAPNLQPDGAYNRTEVPCPLPQAAIQQPCCSGLHQPPPSPLLIGDPMQHGQQPHPFLPCTAPPHIAAPSASHPQRQFLHHQQPQQQWASNFHAPPTQPSVPPVAYSKQGRGECASNAHLVRAHRVGIRAIENIGARIGENGRVNTKFLFSKNPGYATDIQWLFEEVAVELGSDYVYSLLEKAATCIEAPFVLSHLAREGVKYLQLQRMHHQPDTPKTPAASCSSHQLGVFHLQNPGYQQRRVVMHSSGEGHDVSNLAVHQRQPASAGRAYALQAKALLLQHGYHQSIADLVRQCVECCYQAVTRKMSHARFNESDVDDVCELATTARDTFMLLPRNGRYQFDAFCQHIRSQKNCKKEVLQRVNAIQKDRTMFFP